MRVLVYEDNLMWSARILQSLRGLGHDPILLGEPRVEAGDIAILNLSSPKFNAVEFVPLLVAAGVPVVGHAGHKEADLRAMGLAAGCLFVASNSEMTYKLAEILERALSLTR